MSLSNSIISLSEIKLYQTNLQNIITPPKPLEFEPPLDSASSQPIQHAVELAQLLSELSDPTFCRRANSFISEMAILSLALNLNYFDNLVKDFDENKVVWVVFEQTPGILIRLDPIEKTAHFINTTPALEKTAESIYQGQPNPLGKGLALTTKYKLCSAFNFPKDEKLTGSDLIYALKIAYEHIFTSSIDNAFELQRKITAFLNKIYIDFPHTFHFTVQQTDDRNAFSERFFERDDENNPFEIALQYLFQGTFEKSPTLEKEANLAFIQVKFNKHFTDLKRHYKDAASVKDIEKQLVVCIKLISLINILNAKEVIGDTKEIFHSLDYIRIYLEKRKKKLLERTEKLSNHFNFSEVPLDKVTYYYLNTNPKQSSTSSAQDAPSSTSTSPNPQTLKLTKVQSRLHRTIENTNLLKTLKDILDDLEYIYEDFQATLEVKKDNNGKIIGTLRETRNSIDEFLYEELDFYIKKIISILPVPARNDENPFFDSLSSKERTEYTQLLGNIHEAFFGLKLNSSISKLFEYHLLGLIDVLVRKDLNILTEEYKTYSYEIHFLFKDPMLILPSSILQQKALQIIQYFDPQYSFHESFSINRSEDSFKEAILESSFALIQIYKPYFFPYSQSLHYLPLNFMPSQNSLDQEGKTYAFYKQFIDNPDIQAEWEKPGQEAPITEEAKVLWVMQETINGNKCIPESISILQRSVIYTIISAYDKKFQPKFSLFPPKASISQMLVGPPLFREKVPSLQVAYYGSGILICNDASITAEELEKKKSSRYTNFIFDPKDRLPTPNMDYAYGVIHCNSQNDALSKRVENNKSLLITDLIISETNQFGSNPLDILNRLVGFLPRNYQLLTNNLEKVIHVTNAFYQFNRLSFALKYYPDFTPRLYKFVVEAGKVFFESASSDFSRWCALSGFIHSVIVTSHPHLAPEFKELSYWLIKYILPMCTEDIHKYRLYSTICAYCSEPSLESQLYFLFLHNTIEKNRQSESTLFDHTAKMAKAKILEACNKGVEVQSQIFKVLGDIYNTTFEDNISFHTDTMSWGKYQLDLNTFAVSFPNKMQLTKSIHSFVLDGIYNKVYPGRFSFLDNYRENYDVIGKDDDEYELYPKPGKSEYKPLFIHYDQSIRYYRFSVESKGVKYHLLTKKEIEQLTKEYPFLRVGKDRYWASENEDLIYVEVVGLPTIEIRTGKNHIHSLRQGNRIIWHRNQVDTAIRTYFESFQGTPEICYYADKNTQKLCGIRLERIGLEFTIKEEEKIYVNGYAGYYICQKGEFPILPIWGSSLPLINDEGKMKRIFYYRDGEMIVELDYLSEKWTAKNRFSALILAAEFLFSGSYADCMEALKDISLVTDFSNAEIKLIQNLDQSISLLDNKSDKVGLKAYFALFMFDAGVNNPATRISYAEPFEKTKSLLLDAFKLAYEEPLTKAYEIYLGVGAKPGNCLLDVEDEIRIIDLMVSNEKKQIESIPTYVYFLSMEAVLMRMKATRRISCLEAIKNNLEGTSEVTFMTYPIDSKMQKKTSEWMSPNKFQECLSFFEREYIRISKAAKKECEEKEERWKEPISLKEKIALFPAIDPDNIKYQDNFFLTYHYITEVANDEQRNVLIRNLGLGKTKLNEIQKLFLIHLCHNPHHKPSFETLYSLYLQNWSDIPQNRKESTLGAVKLDMLLIGLSTIQFFSYSNGMPSIIKSYFDAAKLWMSTNKCSISLNARVTPWVKPFQLEAGKSIDCSSIDEGYSSLFYAIFEKYFIEHKGSYYLKEGIHLKDVIAQLNTNLVQERQINKVELQQLIHIATSAQHGDHKTAVMRLAQKSVLNEDHIHSLFAQASDDQFREQTNFQDIEEFQKFLVLITQNFMVKSRLGQLNAALINLKDASKIDPCTPAKKQEQDYLINEAVIKLLAKPAYNRGTGRKERLFIAKEAQMGSLIRSDQYRKILNMEANISNEMLYEAPLAYGKTAVIRPTVNALILILGLQPFNILPKGQEIDLARNLERDAKFSFGTKVTRVNVKRNQPFSLMQLREEYARLERKSKSTTTSDPETYQLISIQMDVVAHTWKDTSPKNIPAEALEEIGLCQSILRILLVRGVGVFEEEDQTVNPNYKIIYSLGGLQTYQEAYAEVMGKVVECLLSFDEYGADIQNNNQETWTEEELQGVIFDKLVVYFLNEYQLSGHDAQQFLLFLQCPENDAEFTTSYKWVEAQQLRSKYSLIKGILNIALPQARRGRINARDGYALSLLDPTYEVPIPCEGKDALKETKEGRSQFHHDVALLRAFFYFHAMKLTTEKAMSMLKDTYDKAKVMAEDRIPLSSTAIGQKFQKMLIKAGIPEGQFPVESLKSNKVKTQLAELLRNNAAAINYFVETLPASQIKIYEYTIERTTQFLRSMFHSSISLSATTQKDYAHGPKTKFEPIEWVEEGLTKTAQDIRQMVLTKTGTPSEVRLQLLQSDLVDELLAECIEGVINDGAAAIVEAAPLFCKIPNYQIAKKLAVSFKQREIKAFKGILLFDEKDKTPKVLDIETGALQVLYGSEYREEDLFKLYDETAASNTNWMSVITALFKVVIGPHSTLEEVAQGMGRARLLHLLQSISFIMRNETYKDHFKDKPHISPQDILDFLSRNSDIANRLRGFNALKDQMENELSSVLYRKRLDLSPNKDNWERELATPPNPLVAIQILKENEDKVLTRTPIDPWEVYGPVRKNCSAVIELENVQKKCIGETEQTSSLSAKEKQDSISNLQEFSGKISGPKAVPLPPHVNGINAQINATVEVVRTIEKVPEYSDSVIQTKTNPKYTLDNYYESLNPFIPDFYKPSLLTQTTKKVISFFARAILIIQPLYMGTIIASCFLSVPVVGYNIVRVLVVQGATLAISKFILKYLLGVGVIGAAIFPLSLVVFQKLKNCFTNLTRFEAHYLKDVVAINHSAAVSKVLKMFNADFSTSDTHLNVMVSNNKHKFIDFEEKGESPYYYDSKRLKQVFVVREILPDNKEVLTLIDIDMDDSRQIMAVLTRDRDSIENDPNRIVEVGIYDVEVDQSSESSRFVSYGKNGINVEKVIHNPAFHAGMTLLKLHNGYIDMLPAELNAVTTKLVDSLGLAKLDGKKVLDRYIREGVLTMKMDVEERYQKSQLALALKG